MRCSIVVTALLGTACAHLAQPSRPDLAPIAEEFVKLVLAVGEHDADYVETYYGPPEWRAAVKARGKQPLPELRAKAERLRTALGPIPTGDCPEDLRHGYLLKQLQALSAFLDHLGGTQLGFAEEAQVFFDATLPRPSLDRAREVVRQIDQALPPGDAEVHKRLRAYLSKFYVPADRLERVLAAAITECRRRTLEHIPLPPDESIEIRFVSDGRWSAYSRYQGQHRSQIEVNSPALNVDEVLALACHESYPGHHVFGVLIERELVGRRGWVEHSVQPFYSPLALMAEGTADYGVSLAFPPDERLIFERDVLFPLAGFGPEHAAEAERFGRVLGLANELKLIPIEIARRRVDEQLDDEALVDLFIEATVLSPFEAWSLLSTPEKPGIRAYMANYGLGEALVRSYVERRAGSSRAARWKSFAALMGSPWYPSALREPTSIDSRLGP